MFISGSTKTGFAPAYDTASAVAINVFEGTITSSPAFISSALKIRYSASSPVATPIQYFAPQ